MEKKASSLTNYIIIPSQSKYGKFQNPNKTRQETHKWKSLTPPPTPHPPKWITFTYIGKETTYITKIFKHTNIKIAHLTNNTIQGNLTPKTHNHEKFSATGVYKLICPECGKAYIYQKKGEMYPKCIMNTCAPSETIVNPQNLPSI